MPHSSICFLEIIESVMKKMLCINEMMYLNMKTLKVNNMMISLLLICSQVLEIKLNFFPRQQY